jgi:hypothetical protein
MSKKSKTTVNSAIPDRPEGLRTPNKGTISLRPVNPKRKLNIRFIVIMALWLIGLIIAVYFLGQLS